MYHSFVLPSVIFLQHCIQIFSYFHVSMTMSKQGSDPRYRLWKINKSDDVLSRWLIVVPSTGTISCTSWYNNINIILIHSVHCDLTHSCVHTSRLSLVKHLLHLYFVVYSRNIIVLVLYICNYRISSFVLVKQFFFEFT